MKPDKTVGGGMDASLAATDRLAARVPHNVLKPVEYGDAAYVPAAGQVVEGPAHATASTVSESTSSAKTGKGELSAGVNPLNGPLDRVRVDSSGRPLTTNQGVQVADNQNSLKAGLRGPSLLEDFVLREKLTHFDHERIPERIVHARGSAAHGYFECYSSLRRYTRAGLFAEAGKRTPVFVRFSTVIGERGSADTVRDPRGFAVKFYTEEGNWDLVGNNIPVFFIQDAMKFPDLVHAAKPEPHHGMPQAATAHDTFWDFVSLMPESAHMLLWVMSDRAVPRSYRMMQGFGVHTFRLLNAEEESHFVKFHWRPKAGTHSLEWDEAVRLCGADPDFHRRDLWDAIESGCFPEYELGMQIFTEQDAERYSFDVLDATKIVPEELVPVLPVGRLVLDRNPDNFFAEVEQVAFCAAHIVPGIDFSNDPLLAGRIHSYVDTQISRLGGPNFHEIPINSPLSQGHNNQRDGMHRQAIHRGRVAYEPNSLGGGCPFQAGMRGFRSFPAEVYEDKVRGKPERFADHYTQATLFWNSQTPLEQFHIVRAFRFELAKVGVPAVRSRVLALLANVSAELAGRVADGLGMAVPEPLPLAWNAPRLPEVERSPALSLFAQPGDGSIAGRRIAVLLGGSADMGKADTVEMSLRNAGATVCFLGTRLGRPRRMGDMDPRPTATLDSSPSVLFDAMVILGSTKVARPLATVPAAVDFVQEQYRHCKTILLLDEGKEVLERAGASSLLGNDTPDAGVVAVKDDNLTEALDLFIEAVGKHRHYARASDFGRDQAGVAR